MERGIPSRRSCALLKVSRSLFCYERRDRNKDLRERLYDVLRPGIGYRLAWAKLRKRTPNLSKNRVHRLWKQEGFSLRKEPSKKIKTGRGVPMKAEHANHVWCVDFCFDRCLSGRSLKVLSVVDEYTRECLALEVHRSITGVRVREILSRIAAERGAPKYLRSDNGSEFICRVLRAWVAGSGGTSFFINPGKPWENGFAESFHSRLRPEFLSAEVFANLADAQLKAVCFRRFYNEERPHSSLGYLEPATYAAGLQSRGKD
jgi:putative transposase